jgi:hypothetical protein
VAAAVRLFLPSNSVPDSLTGEGTISMHLRLIASLAIVCIALGLGGCSSFKTERKSSDRQYKEVYMPLQTGSHFQRRIYVPMEREKKPTKKKQSTAPKREPEAEASATPAPEEESTPPAEKFR